MPLLNYTIVPPSDVIEASTSKEPDDTSVATIRIRATWVGAFPAQFQKATFKVFVGNSPRPAGFKEQSTPLTENPKAIIPTVKEHGVWKIIHEAEANGVFEAQLVDSSRKPTNSSSATFLLHDIEVVDQEGDTEIVVTEHISEGQPTNVSLPIRKVNPALRIDFFRAVGPALSATPPTTSPMAPSVNSGVDVTLEWATTAADRVALIGPGGQFVERNATPQERAAGSPPRVPIDGTRETDKDGSVTLALFTTSTFTLVAQKEGAEKVRAVEQVTITVRDHATVVGVLAVTGDVVVTRDVTALAILKGGDLRARRATVGDATFLDAASNRAATDGDLKVQGAVNAGSFTTTGEVSAGTVKADAFTTKSGVSLAVPVGTILMWSPPPGTPQPFVAPAGWEICDGRDLPAGGKTPDLRGRFMVGQGEFTEGTQKFTYTPGAFLDSANEGGKATVELAVRHLPSHSHNFVAAHGGERRVIAGFETRLVLPFGREDDPPSADFIAENDKLQTISIENTGGGIPHENRPPFYVVVYIIRIA